MVAADDLQEACLPSQPGRRPSCPALRGARSMNGHPGSLQLERFSVDDLPAEAHYKTRAHVQECTECRRALDELAQARSECLRELPAEKLLARIAESQRHLTRRWAGIG